jgi:hypothetical protein
MRVYRPILADGVWVGSNTVFGDSGACWHRRDEPRASLISVEVEAQVKLAELLLVDW